MNNVRISLIFPVMVKNYILLQNNKYLSLDNQDHEGTEIRKKILFLILK